MQSLRNAFVLFFLTLILFGVLYPALILGLGSLLPYRSAGSPILRNQELVGFQNIGQSFTSHGYFWGRLSAVGYNAAATGGSNHGPTNPAHIQAVQARIDTLIKYHPGLKASQIPADWVTASGGGLDPHLSAIAILLQVPRVASARNLPEQQVRALVTEHIEGPLLGIFGPGDKVNVLALNLALDTMSRPKSQR